MILNYKIDLKDGMFKYNCITHGSYMEIRKEDTKKIYGILNILDILEKQAAEYGEKNYVCNGFVMLFDFEGCFCIENISNWLSIKEEIPIIKKELSKYIKDYNSKSVKDIIVKIKSLKKGSSN